MQRIITGDILAFARHYKGPKFHAVLVDPPYHLTSIVKRFGAPNAAPAQYGRDGAFARVSTGFMGQTWDGGDVAFRPDTWTAIANLLYPGAHLLAFGGTRTYHRLACAIEDAGFEIRDMVAWLYGSGFPKSLDVSKAIDKAAGAEREKIPGGRGPAYQRSIGNIRPWMEAPEHQIDGPLPATDAAKQWNGWGSALKPAHEDVVWAMKPLTLVPSDDRLLAETQVVIGALLCQLLSGANSVDVLSASSPSVSGEASGSVLLTAAVFHGSGSEEWCERMATSNSPEMVSMCLSIVWSWRTILDAIYQRGTRFTTSMATVLTTALKTLNSCLLNSIPPTIIEAVSRPVGELSTASTAGESSNDKYGNAPCTREHIAAALASLQRARSSAPIADESFMRAARSADSVLRDAITSLAAGMPPEIRPGHEPIVIARLPVEGTVAANCLRYGTGALNIDGCRVETPVLSSEERRSNVGSGDGPVTFGTTRNRAPKFNGLRHNPRGRWPANVAHDGSEEVLAGFPQNIPPSYRKARTADRAASTWSLGRTDQRPFGHTDSGSAARFFYCAKASREEREAGCEGLEAHAVQSHGSITGDGSTFTAPDGTEHSRGASGPARNHHPTVKPIALTRWLATLILPPPLDEPRRILIPFAGVGSEMIGAMQAGWDEIVGVELHAKYTVIAKARLDYYAGLGVQLGLDLGTE